MDRLEVIPERVWECFYTRERHKHPSSVTEVSIPDGVSANIAVLPLPSHFHDSG